MTGEGMDAFCKGLILEVLRVVVPWLLFVAALVALTCRLLT